jgi:DNA repair protein RadA/Sms
LRIELSSPELNRVLGGGIVPGSVALLAGDPGIGKSTMLLRVAADVAMSSGRTLYVSGEESAGQIKMRADRMGLPGTDLHLLQTNDLDDIVSSIEKDKPVLVVVDSIQTVGSTSISAGAGSVAQIRECARVLIQLAKTRGIPTILTGHMTKSGDIAGPKVLEHLVDVVLYLEGDQINAWRLLRAVKNRFGATNEVGVFEMVEEGLTDVRDPSSALLSERVHGAIGSAVVPVIEGTRPLLIEVQALTSPTTLPVPRRVATGIDTNRLLLVCAVLARRLGVKLADQDVLVNVAGGLRISEPAVDLGVALAIVSSLRGTAVAGGLAAVGEIGLSSEIRRVSQIQNRIGEAARLGLTDCIVPAKSSSTEPISHDGISVKPVTTLAEAIALSLTKDRGRPPIDSRVPTT